MRAIFLSLLLGICNLASAQYKNDNKLYATVYLEDLCNALQKNPGYLILDVRSKGEYADTSHFPAANIGYLENSINIDIRELDKRWKELIAYKSKPIFVVCSHSQRSRRASALLAENGFTKVFNINEGLAGINKKKSGGMGCATELYGTKNQFTLVSPAALLALLRKPGKAVLYDLRGDSAMKGISTNERLNAFGTIKGAIPVFSETDMDKKLSVMPKNKTIILVDDFGEKSMEVATLVAREGYTDVRVLLEGMETWMSTAPVDCPGKMDNWIRTAPYQVVTIPEFQSWTEANPGYLLVDLRDSVIFANKSKEAWQNKGHIRGAVNIPAETLEKTAESWSFARDRPILLYHFSNHPDVFKTARILTNQGFSRVAVLSGGLFNLRWQAANIKGREGLFKWVEDIPEGGF
ncbi:rhodanese-like domain-containing protein [Flavihumibacter fluvii]|uniref:rhodanese-like domain-containing protein n=1 Tax=Flavihumibacter fluvii TaxID=2838157 RepID=UPI001BDE6B6F|nr:rhodanese-like domain-containing protein [Flavihumibacter fluvii]ULQ52236.1 rhodanese-like domain-containing protein [Flavihumibacter fluvii]